MLYLKRNVFLEYNPYKFCLISLIVQALQAKIDPKTVFHDESKPFGIEIF